MATPRQSQNGAATSFGVPQQEVQAEAPAPAGVRSSAATPPPASEPTKVPTQQAEPKWDPKSEAFTIKFAPWPGPKQLPSWKSESFRKIKEASGRPVMAIKWLREIDKATKVENLSDDGSFETLSAKIFSGIFDILPISNDKWSWKTKNTNKKRIGP